MIFGVGTDIVQVTRMRDALSRSPSRFVQKILGAQEQEVFLRRQGEAGAKGERYVATRFAAKEALAKAMGIGFRAPLSWHGVQLLNRENGQPFFVFGEEMQAWFREKQVSAHVSISDEREYVLAFVVLEISASALDTKLVGDD